MVVSMANVQKLFRLCILVYVRGLPTEGRITFFKSKIMFNGH